MVGRLDAEQHESQPRKTAIAKDARSATAAGPIAWPASSDSQHAGTLISRTLLCLLQTSELRRSWLILILRHAAAKQLDRVGAPRVTGRSRKQSSKPTLGDPPQPHSLPVQVISISYSRRAYHMSGLRTGVRPLGSQRWRCKGIY